MAENPSTNAPSAGISTEAEANVFSAVALGEWLDPEQLHGKSLAAAATAEDVSIDLEGLDYLDGSSLQILLALASAQKQEGRSLHLLHPSAQLRQWFDYAGAPHLLPIERS